MNGSAVRNGILFSQGVSVIQQVLLQVVFFVGVQLDITKEPRADQKEASVRFNKESGSEDQVLPSSVDILAGLNLEDNRQAINGQHPVELVPSVRAATLANESSGQSGLQNGLPQANGACNGSESARGADPEPRETIGSQEKQMQRSVVGTVGFHLSLEENCANSFNFVVTNLIARTGMANPEEQEGFGSRMYRHSCEDANQIEVSRIPCKSGPVCLSILTKELHRFVWCVDPCLQSQGSVAASMINTGRMLMTSTYPRAQAEVVWSLADWTCRLWAAAISESSHSLFWGPTIMVLSNRLESLQDSLTRLDSLWALLGALKIFKSSYEEL